MLYLEALILALALSADAFSVAATVGMFHRAPVQVARVSLHFGLFQVVMAAIGAIFGALFLPLIEGFDHWVVCVLLVGLGLRMIYLGLRGHSPAEREGDLTQGLPLIGLSLAVSIDALAAGVTLPATNLPPIRTVVTIGLVTAAAAVLGMRLAEHVKRWAGRRSEVLAGAVLIVLGITTPLNHLGYL
jgi:putative Mn2+ efflux pump MntP